MEDVRSCSNSLPNLSRIESLNLKVAPKKNLRVKIEEKVTFCISGFCLPVTSSDFLLLIPDEVVELSDKLTLEEDEG